jgi:hypothetical protein
MKAKNPPFSLRSLRAFAGQHDDLPAFHAAYLVLTLLAAALFNLGFFAALIVLHMALDIFKYRDVHGYSWRKTAEGMVRESIVDISLLSMGLAVTVYLHPSVPLFAGVQGIMLAEITLLRAIGVITPKLKILYDFLKVIAHIDVYLRHLHPRLGKRPSIIEYVATLSLFVAIGLLLIAPLILLIDPAQYSRILVDEMIPWTH